MAAKALAWRTARRTTERITAARAREAPTFPRGPFDFAPISSVTSLLSAGKRIPARRIPTIQRSVLATQSKAKRRAEKGQRSSTPELWQTSMNKWRTAAARAARKIGTGDIIASVCPRLRRRKGIVARRLKKKAAGRE